MGVTIDLKGQVALVTGASRGIGRAVASRLAEAGADVALCARNQEALEGLAAELRERHGVRALALPTDVASRDSVEACVKRTTEELGRLDILVNNAGITRDGLLARMSDEAWREVMDTNATGAFLFTRAASRSMMRQRSGRIVNVSSVVGLRGNAGQSNYAASKAALVGFTKSVARELGSRGVTANVVAPGFIETDMTAALGDERKAAVAGEVPLGRLGSADDVAWAVLFLAGPQGAYVTGAVLCVDGGIGM